MRGIIAEVNEKYAIILAQDGSFKKIKAVSHMAVGNEIDLDQPSDNIKATRLISKVSAIAAGALFILGLGYGAYSYTVPYSYVDVDINPSIELTVNIYDRIIGTEAFNEDGRRILESRDLRNTSLKSGVTLILSTALEQGYLTAEVENEGGSETGAPESDAPDGTNTGSDGIETVIENAVLFTVASNSGNKSEVLAKKLAETASEKLEKDSVNSEVLVGEASVTQRNDARVFGVTPGKLVLMEDALKSEPELTLEDLKNASVKDLIQKAKDKKAEMEKQEAERKKLEEEKQQKKAEKLKAAEDNNGDKAVKDKGKSETKVNGGSSTKPPESGAEQQEKTALQGRLFEQMEILNKMSGWNDKNNGTDTKDESDGKDKDNKDNKDSDILREQAGKMKENTLMERVSEQLEIFRKQSEKNQKDNETDKQGESRSQTGNNAAADSKYNSGIGNSSGGNNNSKSSGGKYNGGGNDNSKSSGSKYNGGGNDNSKNSGSGNNSSINKNNSNNSNNNNINSSKSNYNRQDAAEIPEKQKKEQQLKKGLLEQLLDANISDKSKEPENKAKTKENKENAKNSEDKSEEKKDYKGRNKGGKR